MRINDIKGLKKYLWGKKLPRDKSIQILEKIYLLDDFQIQINEEIIDKLASCTDQYDLDRKIRFYIDEKLGG